MKYKKTTLPNGVRIVTVPAKGNPAATVFVAVETGSNTETKEQNGLSHFLEHMVFKGTTRRPNPTDIHMEIDMLGAENNAFTSNDFTGYYAKAGKKNWKKILDIISDMYIDPIFPKTELEKERGVILQEISMYEDLPQRKVQDLFAKLVYGDTSPGRPIIGPAKNIKRFKREDFIEYRKKQYTPERTVVVIAGDVPEKEAIKEATKLFKDLQKGKHIGRVKVKSNQTKPELLIHKKITDQTHMVLGFKTFGARDKRNTAITLLAGVLSAGMSSRLFKRLRTDMGSCYYVRASHNPGSTYGDFTISTGINISRVGEVVKVLLEECTKLKETLVSETELNKVKEYLISHLNMNLETTDAMAEFFGLEEVIKGSMETPEEIEKKIRYVKARDIQTIAKKIFTNDNLNLAIIGNIEKEAPIKKILSF